MIKVWLVKFENGEEAHIMGEPEYIASLEGVVSAHYLYWVKK